MSWTPTFGIKLVDMTKELQTKLASVEREFKELVEQMKKDSLEFDFDVLNVFGVELAVFDCDSSRLSTVWHKILIENKIQHVILNDESDNCEYCSGQWK